MVIENPTSTIRKAIHGKAENLASVEFLEKPEERHFQEAFAIYRFLKYMEPERLEELIKISAKRKELKDQIGIKSYKTFNTVWDQLLQGYENKIDKAVKQSNETKGLSKKELIEEVKNLYNRFLKERGEQFKEDPRIKTIFQEKEELLNECVENEILNTFDILTCSDKYLFYE